MSHELSGTCHSFDHPFSHFTIDRVFSADTAERILDWLETTDLWSYHESNLYRSYSFHLNDEHRPPGVDLFTPSALARFKASIEAHFGTKFANEFTVSANKNVEGQSTGVHNDYTAPESRPRYFFTHRFLVYLNRGWEPEQGGLLGLFDSPSPGSLMKTIIPRHNSGVGLVISKKSFHAVSRIRSGERFNLMFGFASTDMVPC